MEKEYIHHLNSFTLDNSKTTQYKAQANMSTTMAQFTKAN